MMILNYAFAVVIVALICGHDAISSDQPSSMDNFAVGSRTQMNEQINKDLLRDIINQYLKKVHNTPQETVAIKTGKELVTSSGNVKTLNLKMTKPQSPGVFQAPNAAAADLTTKTSSLRPMHLRTIGLRDNQLEKVKTLNAQAQKPSEATKKLSFSSETNLAGTNNLAAYHPHHQQYYHGHAQHYNPQFDQSMMYQNQFAMPNQAQQYNQALMGQQQQQQYSADSSNTYFQSASFGNNRKNNELKKARKEMITDSDFLRDNPKLGHFLYIKYMKEASNSPGDNDLPNKESLPKGPAKFKSIKQQQDKEKEKEKKKSGKDEETRTSKKKQPVETKKVDEEKTAEIEKNKQSIIEKKESEEIKNNKSGEKKDEEKVGEEKRDGVKDKKLIDEETLKKITAKFAAKDSKSKNVFLVDADDLANYLSNMKIEN